jgi:hypothetical protein
MLKIDCFLSQLLWPNFTDFKLRYSSGVLLFGIMWVLSMLLLPV